MVYNQDTSNFINAIANGRAVDFVNEYKKQHGAEDLKELVNTEHGWSYIITIGKLSLEEKKAALGCLIENGLDINQPDTRFSHSALYYCARRFQLDLATWLAQEHKATMDMKELYDMITKHQLLNTPEARQFALNWYDRFYQNFKDQLTYTPGKDQSYLPNCKPTATVGSPTSSYGLDVS